MNLNITLSQLDRVEACPGSTYLSIGLPEEESSDPAKRGTALHKAVEIMLAQGDPELDTLARESVEDIFQVTEEDLEDAVTVYWQVLAAKPKETDARLLMEHELSYAVEMGLDKVIRSDGSVSNRTDFVWLVPGFFAVILEAKFGFKIVPHPAVNRQTMGQAVCIAREFRLPDVQVQILQPKNFSQPVRTSHFDETRIDLAEALLKSRIYAAREKDAPLSAGEHCTFCPARLTCPVRSQAPVVPKGEQFAPWFKSLTPDARKTAFEKAKVFADYAADLYSTMKDEARTHAIAGWSWKTTNKRTRVWLNQKEARKVLKTLGKEFKVKYDDLAGASPSQAEKLLPKTEAVKLAIKDLTGYDLSENEAFAEDDDE